MRYYNAPLPWTSVSVSRILPDTARFFAGTIDLSVLNTLRAQISALVYGTERPAITDFTAVFLYYTILVDMTIIQGVLFAVNILAFVFIGIGSLLGPTFHSVAGGSQTQLAVLELGSIHAPVQLLSSRRECSYVHMGNCTGELY